MRNISHIRTSWVKKKMGFRKQQSVGGGKRGGAFGAEVGRGAGGGPLEKKR